MKDMRKTIKELGALEKICRNNAIKQRERGYPWGSFCETIKAAIAALEETGRHGSDKWTPIESGLPGENIDVQVTVQDMEYDGNVYQSIDCIIDNGDGPFWAEHHGAWDRVLAWAPMLPVYQPDEGRRD